jgi:DNA-binding MarR family transcriptional regulator
MKRPKPQASKLHIEDYVPSLVNRAGTAMLSYSAREFQQLGLTVPQFRILLTLWHHDECRFGDLATLTSIEPPTLSRLLNGMAAGKLVKRKRSVEDTRSVTLSLTAAGRALFEKVIPFADRCDELYTAGISASDLAVLRRTLTAIYHNVRAADEKSS